MALNSEKPAILSNLPPIVLKQVKDLEGQPIARLNIFRFHQNKWEEIVFQIDQKNERDEFVLSEGLPFTKNSDDGVFDHNDELVLMAESLGVDFTNKDMEKLATRFERSWKISIAVESESVGHLLVVLTEAAKLQNLNIAASYDSKKQTIDTQMYRYFFNQQSAVLLGKIFIKNGESYTQAIEDSRFVMPLKTSWYLPDWDLQDLHFESTVESWQEGPVRTIVAVGVKYSRLFSLINLHMFSELVFYKSNFHIPARLEFPLDAKKFLRAGSGLAYSIRLPVNSGWEIQTNLQRLPPMDAKTVLSRAKDFPKPDVYSVHGHNAKMKSAFWVRLNLERKSLASYPPPFLVRDSDFSDKKLQEYWPWLNQIPGDFGIFVDLSKVRRGVYNFGLDLSLFEMSQPTRYVEYRHSWYSL